MQYREKITGIVLAGGKSTRMGTDKAFVLWNNKPFIQYSIDALSTMVDEIIIVSDYAKFDRLGYKRVEDCISEAGPLSAMYSGLKESKTELNLVLSCDIPLITSDVLEELLIAHHKDLDAVVCRANDTVMPLVALYDKCCYKTCESLLQSGERRMMRLMDVLPNVSYLHLNDAQSISVKNINSPMDLNEINDAS